MNISIKNAPEDLVERLRARAERNHRSLQGELMAILEQAARQPLGAADESASRASSGFREPASAWRGFFGPGPSTDEIMALLRGGD